MLLLLASSPSVVSSFSFLTMSAAAATTAAAAVVVKPKIAVIGSGAAGLAAARCIDKTGLWTPVVLERTLYSGGVWKYQQADDSTTTTKTSPMYAGLRTNLPKEIMAYKEYAWTNNSNSKGPSLKSFVTHKQVLEYLDDYRQHFELDRFIRTGCMVDHLKVLPTTTDSGATNDIPSCLSPALESWPRIQLDWTVVTNTKDGGSSSHKESDIFDGVCICNGHYGLAAVPEVPGLQDYYKGETMHSIAYDKPEAFAGKTVLCIGGRASGADLAREIAAHAHAVFLSDTVEPPLDDTKIPVTQDKVTWVPKTLAVQPDGTIQFDLDCSVHPVVDMIIFCTGYDYSFPFVTEDSGLALDAALGNRRVSPLYEQFWHADCPNVVFLGLPHSVVPFPLFESQAAATVEQWRHWTLPNLATRQEQAATDAVAGGEGKEDGRVPQDTHFLGGAQWDYFRRMAKYAGIYDEDMEKYIATNKVS